MLNMRLAKSKLGLLYDIAKVLDRGSQIELNVGATINLLPNLHETNRFLNLGSLLSDRKKQTDWTA